MIIPDANLLLYAHDSTSPFHERARDWWANCLTGTEPVGLLASVLMAFVRIGTSAKIFEHPLSIHEAALLLRSWIEVPNSEVLAVQRTDLEQALAWLEAAGAGGNLTMDAQIAAVAKRCRAQVHTADTDFSRFPGVRWQNPLL